MATKNTKKELKAVLNKVTKASTKVNKFALESTENVVSKAIKTATKWQGMFHTVLKGGLQFSANKQELVFNTLDTVKGKAVKGFFKSKNIFNKK